MTVWRNIFFYKRKAKYMALPMSYLDFTVHALYNVIRLCDATFRHLETLCSLTRQ